jgi:hypothetical protein
VKIAKYANSMKSARTSAVAVTHQTRKWNFKMITVLKLSLSQHPD